jgi:outer membrane receptor protein involved in Fe transport
MTHSSAQSIWRTMSCVSLLVVVCGALFGAEKRSFDIPPGTADISLKQFIAQSGAEVVYPAEIVRGVRTQPVKGEMTPEDAIQQLLAGSVLSVKQGTNSTAFIISRDPNGQRAAPAIVSDRPIKPSLTDETIELSPFQVTASEDHGYQATSTLGGTRLRTDLKDLAASISVVTKDFMDDLAVDNLGRLANYTVGTEVSGIDGNYSGASFNASATPFTDFSDTVRQVQPTVRVRGLAVASATRDYFLTDLPADSYNIERMEFQRGPNGMLYGLGSPAGVINQVMSKADLRRNKSRVTTRLDNNGGYRAALDHNQVLLRDRLAVRFATLYDRAEYQIKEAFNLDRRGYGTVTYRPFKDTTLRVNGEMSLLNGTPPQYRPPLDAFSYWWDSGKPVYNAATQTFSFLGARPTGPGYNGNPNQFLVTFQHRAPNPSVIVEDPATGVYGLSIPGRPQAAELASTRIFPNASGVYTTNGVIYSTGAATAYRRTFGQAGSFATNFWRNPMINDPEIFDFFHHQLDGTSRNRGAKWGTYNIALEQRLGPHAGLEVAYDRQDYHSRYRDYVQFNRYTINLDVTTVLNDGTPNPNFGRPFMADANFGGSTAIRREATRATAYYDFDFKRIFREQSLLARILGRHTLTSNYTLQSSITNTRSGNEMLDANYYNILQAANAGTTTIANTRPNGGRQLNVVSYLGPNLAGSSSPQNQGIRGMGVDANTIDSGLDKVTLFYRPVPPIGSNVASPYRIGTFGVIRPTEWDFSPISTNATRKSERFKALSAVVQDRWFENTVVTTLGVRRDWVRTFDAGSPVYDDLGNLQANEKVWPLLPALDQRHDAFNYGAVLHAPRFITRHLPEGTAFGFTYNHSDNFTPQASRINVFGERIDPTMGKTKDYGFYLSLFNRKIDLRVSHYHSASTLSTNGSLRDSWVSLARPFYDLVGYLNGGQIQFLPDGVTPVTQARQAFLDFLRSPAGARFFRPEVAGWYVDSGGNLQGVRDGYEGRVFGTSDIDAKGWEVELTANPTDHWRISANVAKQEPVLSNTGSDVWAMLQSWRPYLVDSAAGDLPPNLSGTSSVRALFLSSQASTARLRALDGSISPEVRKWRFNLVNNYSFTRGALKGWGIGGSVRWQDKAAIGYPVILFEGAGQFDVKHPFFGPADRSYDAWLSYGRRLWRDRVRWKAQLNARNIGVHNRLIPVSTQPDGTIDAWRISSDTTWILSNSFDF